MYNQRASVTYVYNFVAEAPSNKLVTTQSKIIYEFSERNQEYMSLFYTLINDTAVSHCRIRGIISESVCKNGLWVNIIV